MKLKILHLTNWLNLGGAEVMMINLLAGTDRGRFDPMVCTLIDDMLLAPRIDALDVPITTLGMKPGIPDPRAVAKLVRLLKKEKPDVIQTWLFQSDLIGGIAAKIAGGIPVVWGVHHSNHDTKITKRSTRLTVAACSKLSRFLPARIVCCTEAAKACQLKNGYAPEKLEVINNGFDLESFRPVASAPADLRMELGLSSDALLVGHLARFHPQKDHDNLLRAMHLLGNKLRNTHLLLCGTNIDSQNHDLVSLIDQHGVTDRCHLLGARSDVPRLLAGVDVVCSSSRSGEALPMVLGEAMACGTPCVTTDVGDSAQLVGDVGRVVPPGDPTLLADAIHELLVMSPADRASLGEAARSRVQDGFSLKAAVDRYQKIYEEVTRGNRVAGVSFGGSGTFTHETIGIPS